MITVATKAQEAEFNKLQDQRLEHLKADLSDQFQKQIDQIRQESQEIALKLAESMKEAKEVVNRLESNGFSEKEKYKVMFEKLSSDLVEIGDNVGLIMSELGTHQ